MLSKKTIEEISEKIKIPHFQKHDLRYNDGDWRWEGKDFPRIPALIEFRKMNCHSKKMLTFNAPFDPELEFIETKRVDNFNYIDNPKEYDLHSFNFSDKDYDFVMFNQTLEHLYDPYTVMKNVNSHMKSGGYFYANVPCNNIPHEEPNHFYTGFTSMGLGALMVETGFKIIKLGQWGNFDYLNKLFNCGWVDYRQVSWENQGRCPIICWVLAVKI